MLNCIGFVESSRELIENLPGTGENNEKPVRKADVPPEARTEHLPNVSLQRCRYVDPLVFKNINTLRED
jgi:hypothetical protein